MPYARLPLLLRMPYESLSLLLRHAGVCKRETAYALCELVLAAAACRRMQGLPFFYPALSNVAFAGASRLYFGWLYFGWLGLT